MTYADGSEQQELARGILKKMSFPNALYMDEVKWPYSSYPPATAGVTSFPISELENYRNRFPIPIPRIQANPNNLKAILSLCKGW